MKIFQLFKINADEFRELEDKFGKLCLYASWQLISNNSRNNHQLDVDDIKQELLMSVIRAGSYYKRQTYIESSFEILEKYVLDDGIFKKIFDSLKDLWKNKTHHGAYRRKFGDPQEEILEKLIKKFVPLQQRPDINLRLDINAKFVIYTKQIIWNAARHVGKKITKEKHLRVGQVSLSEHEHLYI
jgi:hypothetical protein